MTDQPTYSIDPAALKDAAAQAEALIRTIPTSTLRALASPPAPAGTTCYKADDKTVKSTPKPLGMCP